MCVYIYIYIYKFKIPRDEKLFMQIHIISTAIDTSYTNFGAFQVTLVVKNLTASAEDVREEGLIPGWARFSGGVCGNTPNYCCLETPMNRGARQAIATVHRVTQSWTGLKHLSTRMHVHAHTHTHTHTHT